MPSRTEDDKSYTIELGDFDEYEELSIPMHLRHGPDPEWEFRVLPKGNWGASLETTLRDNDVHPNHVHICLAGKRGVFVWYKRNSGNKTFKYTVKKEKFNASALTQSGDSQLAWVVRVCAHGTDGMRDSGLFGPEAA
jgi:uncharacterized protein (DUF2249 family)